MKVWGGSRCWIFQNILTVNCVGHVCVVYVHCLLAGLTYSLLCILRGGTLSTDTKNLLEVRRPWNPSIFLQPSGGTPNFWLFVSLLNCCWEPHNLTVLLLSLFKCLETTAWPWLYWSVICHFVTVYCLYFGMSISVLLFGHFPVIVYFQTHWWNIVNQQVKTPENVCFVVAPPIRMMTLADEQRTTTHANVLSWWTFLTLTPIYN